MSLVSVHCPRCRQKHVVQHQFLGTIGQCQRCGLKFERAVPPTPLAVHVVACVLMVGGCLWLGYVVNRSTSEPERTAQAQVKPPVHPTAYAPPREPDMPPAPVKAVEAPPRAEPPAHEPGPPAPEPAPPKIENMPEPPPGPDPKEIARITRERQAVADLRSAKTSLHVAGELRREWKRAQAIDLSKKAEKKLEAIVADYPETPAAKAAKKMLDDMVADREPNLDLAEVKAPDLPGPAAASKAADRGAADDAPGDASTDGRIRTQTPNGNKTEHVNGYTRKDGKYVAPYQRAAPGMGRGKR